MACLQKQVSLYFIHSQVSQSAIKTNNKTNQEMPRERHGWTSWCRSCSAYWLHWSVGSLWPRSSSNESCSAICHNSLQCHPALATVHNFAPCKVSRPRDSRVFAMPSYTRHSSWNHCHHRPLHDKWTNSYTLFDNVINLYLLICSTCFIYLNNVTELMCSFFMISNMQFA